MSFKLLVSAVATATSMLSPAFAEEQNPRQKWLDCRVYDQTEVPTTEGLAGCLVHWRDAIENARGNQCHAAQDVFEKAIRGAYGTLPSDYRMLKCSDAREVIEELDIKPN
jgi:hypothetical protein